jgi:hypothetical protein
MGTTSNAAAAAVRRRGIDELGEASGIGRHRAPSLHDAFLRARTLSPAGLRCWWRYLGWLMARRVQHASTRDTDIVMLGVQHWVDVACGSRSCRARTGYWQNAAISSPSARRIAGRMKADHDDHHRHQWAHHDSAVQASNRLDHERPSSRELEHYSRVRFVDKVVNWKVLGEHSLRKANNLLTSQLSASRSHSPCRTRRPSRPNTERPRRKRRDSARSGLLQALAPSDGDRSERDSSRRQ